MMKSRRAFLQTTWRALGGTMASVTLPGGTTIARERGFEVTHRHTLISSRLHRLHPDVCVISGVNEDISRRNGARVVSSTLIRTEMGVVVIDPGPTQQWGAAVRLAAQQYFGQQVGWVVNTHAHPENVLGNSAFEGLPIFASAEVRDLMQQRCQNCLQRLRHTVGESAMRDTKIVLPNQLLINGQSLQWGGRILQAKVFERAHSVGDTALFDVASGIVCAGGLAYRERIPEMQEASLIGWLHALDALAQWPIKQVISAGSGTPMQTLVPTRAYLSALQEAINERLRLGEDGADASKKISLPQWQHWSGYASRHAQNVQHAWQELEREWMQSERTPL